MNGNTRYVNDHLEHPDQLTARRESLVSKQTPFAIIVGCSDSRVPPEIIFDQSLGDLFIVRLAGNVVSHQNCGVVSAVIDKQIKNLTKIAKLIQPAVDQAKKCKVPLLNCTVKENVKLVVSGLKKKKQLADLITKGQFKIIGGYYDLDTGEV